MSIKIRNLDSNKPLEKSYLFTENLLVASPITCHSGIGITEPSLVTKKGEALKTSLYIFHLSQLPSYLLDSTLQNALSAICMFGNSKYAIICK